MRLNNYNCRQHGLFEGQLAVRAHFGFSKRSTFAYRLKQWKVTGAGGAIALPLVSLLKGRWSSDAKNKINGILLT